jgi:predicted nucleotidyltransferase
VYALGNQLTPEQAAEVRMSENAGVKIAVSQDEVAAFCRRHHIRRLALFGSVLRDDFTPDSDVDVLVEFEPSHTPGLAFFAMQDELSKLLGRRVDLNTPGFLSEYFRDEVLEEAQPIYEPP